MNASYTGLIYKNDIFITSQTEHFRDAMLIIKHKYDKNWKLQTSTVKLLQSHRLRDM